MAYKVLGQTTATAAAATQTLNLIKDPSYEGASINMGPASAANTLYSVTGTNTWQFSASGTSSIYVRRNSADASIAVTPYTGTQAMYFQPAVNTATDDVYMTYGTGSSTTDANTAVAIPVTGSTTYYFGAFLYCHGSSVTTKNGTTYMMVRWFGGSTANTFLSTSSITMTKTASAWTRTTSSAVAPSTATYAVISIFNSFQSTANGFANVIDGIHFSTVADTNTTYPDNAQSSNITLTTPYTGRLKWNWSGTANASTTFSSFAGAMTDVYTVPTGSSAVVSTLIVNNLSTAATTFRVAVLPSGQTIANKNLLLFDAPIGANASEALTLGITLAAGDKIQVSSDVATVSATAFGSEN
jgi:hypothetical protein